MKYHPKAASYVQNFMFFYKARFVASFVTFSGLE